jgi:hypothetical protein
VSELIDYDTVKSALEQLASERPEHVSERFARPGYSNTGCRYLDDEGCPSCIIGVLLDGLGFDREILRELDVEDISGDAAGPFALSSSRHPALSRFAPDARNFMAAVQAQQDASGTTWSSAVGYGIAYAPKDAG